MLQFKSNKDGAENVSFEEAILNGYAKDGGLYVPEYLPNLSVEQLSEWKDLSYKELAFEVLSLFIDRKIISETNLKKIISNSYDSFDSEEVIPLYKLKSREHIYIMELFYGPTLSFKDIGMSFLVNLIQFFLQRRKEHLSLIVATTGDTGPAAAHFIAGKPNLNGWLLYPKGLITEEQERQMTTLPHQNIYPVGVSNCPEGGDDLDAVISKLYADISFKSKLKLSSVNSLNWGRIMMQTVHYFYGYFRIADNVGEEINIAVPSGGFGNLCAGGLARKMGLPIKYFVAANNKNACIHRIFRDGIFSKAELHETVSSAIDILVPINFWRYLYFCVGRDSQKLKKWMDEFAEKGMVQFDNTTHKAFSQGFLSYSISDEQTLKVMKEIYHVENYVLDPHGAIALAATKSLQKKLGNHKLLCMATAHPAKFPAIIKQMLGNKIIPKMAKHPSIEAAKNLCQKTYSCDYSFLEAAIKNLMVKSWDLQNKID